MIRNPGSFRDPMGHIYEANNKIYRLIHEAGRDQYEAIPPELFEQAVDAGFLIPTTPLAEQDWPSQGTNCAYVLEHQKIPYVSYPYEWSFQQLKDAARHHIDFQLFLLNNDVVLKDASAYNIQFIGAKPIFIDALSLAPYREGDYWLGYRQFCMQFLNPLLLHSTLGVTHNDWFRGSLEGIPTAQLAKMLPFYKKLNWRALVHISLQNYFDKSASKNEQKTIRKASSQKGYAKPAYQGLLSQMQKWVCRLEPKASARTYWWQYAHTNTYDNAETNHKSRFIAEFIHAIKPNLLIDLGCNTGQYALLALDNGAGSVVGFDFDQSALAEAYQQAKLSAKPFLPLFLDASNPSPSQGWLQTERQGFIERAKADAIIALAFIHHLAIAKNIPLAELVQWLVSLAPQGVIEFIPKTDPTIVTMLALREDIFTDYSQANFESLLSQQAQILKQETITDSGRTLYWYARQQA